MSGKRSAILMEIMFVYYYIIVKLDLDNKSNLDKVKK